MKTIRVHPSPFEKTFRSSPRGTVFYLNLHELKYGLDRIYDPPRIRLLEDGWVGQATLCELLDEWPEAPDYYPPEWAPGQPMHPHIIDPRAVRR